MKEKAESKAEETLKPISEYLSELDTLSSTKIQPDTAADDKQCEIQDNEDTKDVINGNTEVVKKKQSSKERKGWTEDKEDLLAHLWCQEKLLYERTHDDHNNPVERSQAEYRIAKGLGIHGNNF